MAKAPLNPVHPERICWGCDKYCQADDLRCGNGTVRTMHPCELFGDDWLAWSHSRKRTGGEGRSRESVPGDSYTGDDDALTA